MTSFCVFRLAVAVNTNCSVCMVYTMYMLYTVHLVHTECMVYSVHSVHGVHSVHSVFRGDTYNLRSSDRATTDVDDMAIAAEAIHGANSIPSGQRTPEHTRINMEANCTLMVSIAGQLSRK